MNNTETKKPIPLVYRIGIAADKLGVSRNTIYRMVNAGALELVKISARASGITAASIAAHMEQGKGATTGQRPAKIRP